MIGFNFIKHLPKKPLLGLAVLAVALGAAVGGTASYASAATSYNVEIAFDHVTWSSIDDGIADHTAEVYGTLTADTFGINNGGSYRRLASEGRNSCSTSWSGSALCNKSVKSGTPYFFSQTMLSSSMALEQPASNYAFNNNKMVLKVAGGDSVIVRVALKDYDSASGDDNMCMLSIKFKLSDAQLQTLNQDVSLSPMPNTTSNGICVATVHLRRV